MWAGMSSGPSIVCVQYGASSGTASLNQDSKSSRTSGEAFSFSVSDADVWRMNRCSEPDAQLAQLGQRRLDLARDEVEAARPRAQRDLALDPHGRAGYAGQPRHAHVDALAAERDALGLEQRALARALGQRAVGAHDPPPRHVGSSQREQHGAGEARRARRDVAVGAHEARRGVADAGQDLLGARSSSRISSRDAPRHLLDRRPRPGDRRARRGRPVALVLRRLAVHVGAARGRRGRDAVGRRARVTARTRSTGSPAASDAAGRARRAARRRPAGAPCARSASSTRDGSVAVHTGPDCIAERRPRDRRALDAARRT